MILKLGAMTTPANGVPRVGGGDPPISFGIGLLFKCSPRRRG